MQLHCGSHVLDLATPVVMGVLNLTPDSFADGGRHATRAAAVAHALRMVDEGAAFIDIGGESTRPGAEPVPVDEELRRVIPVLEDLVARVAVPVSVDTRHPVVMRAAVAAGAAMINDVAALREPGALAAVAGSGAAVCLMHMQGQPRGMQRDPAYADVTGEVREFLRGRVAACVAAGIPASRLVVDPGFGFGKALAHNLELLRRLPELAADGLPVLVGMSRKSMVGQLTGRGVDERLPGSLALAVLAILGGARIVRAHDVGPTVDAVKVAAGFAGVQGRVG
ncbi:MAG: dihydropteroate synthase [Gammaproteobacteria bacterium]|nr:MAG: dihydropteroate synthase [Gammaproteobacteria bacterium]